MNDVVSAPEASAAVQGDAPTDVSRALRNAFRLAISLVATWGVSLAIRIVLPRALGPAGFGVYNFADAFSATCFIAITLGVDQYIHKEIPLRLEHASDFVGAVFALRLSGGVLIGLAMWGGLLVSHRNPEVQAVVLLFAGTQLFSLNNDSLAALLHAANRIDGLTVANISIKLLWGAVMIALALTQAGLPALAGATLGSEVIRSGWLWLLARRALGLTWRLDLRGARLVILASLPYFVTAVAHTAYGKVDATMLSFLSSDTEIGYYGAASNLGSLTLILTPLIGWVLLPLTARAAARSREELLALMRNSLRAILSLAIPIALAIWLAASDLVHLTFGSVFQPSAITLEVLAPLFVVTYVAIVASTSLVRLDRAWTVTAISLGGLAITPVLNLLLVRPTAALLGAGGAAAGAAVALLITELSVTTAMLVCLGGEILSRDNLRSIAFGLASAGGVVALDHALLSRFGAWRYALDGSAYLGLAVATSALRPRELFQFVGDGLGNRRRH